jgi:hypothetical protein
MRPEYYVQTRAKYGSFGVWAMVSGPLGSLRTARRFMDHEQDRYDDQRHFRYRIVKLTEVK